MISSNKEQLVRAGNEIVGVQQDVTQALASFQGVSGDQIKTLVNPITTDLKPVLERVDQLFLLFPVVLPIIILFICVEFQDGTTPVFIAAQNGQAECLRLLLDHGANKDRAMVGPNILL